MEDKSKRDKRVKRRTAVEGEDAGDSRGDAHEDPLSGRDRDSVAAKRIGDVKVEGRDVAARLRGSTARLVRLHARQRTWMR